MVSLNSWPMGGLLGKHLARVTSEVQKTGPWRIFGDFFREPAQGDFRVGAFTGIAGKLIKTH